MSRIALCPADTRNRTAMPGFPGTPDPALGEVCAELFASLPRRDQRAKGLGYIRGLLDAPGRKSIRNIAAYLGGPALEQSLHHFVSSSTWDWMPVRRALTRYVARVAPPQAWVLQTMVIPKAGENTVGVEKQYVPPLGQVVNAQSAVGLWAATATASYPVNWRLLLSDAWLDDDVRRTQASIPDGVRPQTREGCAVDTYLDMADSRDLPVRPVVLDARAYQLPGLVRRLRAAHTTGLPMLARISGHESFAVADSAMPSVGAGPVPAHRILGMAAGMRRPVPWRHPVRASARVSLVAGVRVRTSERTARGAEMLLLGAGSDPRRWPSEMWLTDMVTVRPAALLTWSALIDRVEADFDRVSDPVGMRDFTGRSFGGWHRHVTLASAAHAIAAPAAQGMGGGLGLLAG